MRLFIALILALLASALSACDFTPTLDIPLPEFEPGLALNGVLEADSTIEVRITAATDPFAAEPDGDTFRVPDGLEVVLESDGVSQGPLRLESVLCEDYSSGWFRPDEEVPTFECGAFVSDVVVEAGRTYTVRAEAPGFPDASATVTVPRRVTASVSGGPTTEGRYAADGKQFDTDLVVSIEDPPGRGQRYALQVLGRPYYYPHGGTLCSNGDCTFVPDDPPDSTYVASPGVGYTTTDPVLLAGARAVPSTGISFISFTDDEFDGRRRSFLVRAQQIWFPSYRRPEPEPPIGARIISADEATFQAYQIAWFGGGEDNPFAEPVNLPSNVSGGYGLLGAATITEALLND